MSQFTKREYQAEISVLAEWKKYASPEHLEKLLDRLMESQPLPSQITIERFLGKLKFPRTDSGSAQSDAEAAQKLAQNTYNEAVKGAHDIPLTPAELREFASLSPVVLQQRYFEDSSDGAFFRIRYNRACDEHGFKRPFPPKLPLQAAAAAVPRGEELHLTVEEYRVMPARLVAQRCLREPRFHAAVLRLAAEGKI
jgi:hypothetical protein